MKEVYVEGLFIPSNKMTSEHLAITPETFNEIFGEYPITNAEYYDDFYETYEYYDDFYETYGSDGFEHRYIDENKFFNELVNIYPCEMVYDSGIPEEERILIRDMFNNLNNTNRIANVSFTLHVLDDND